MQESQKLSKCVNCEKIVPEVDVDRVAYNKTLGRMISWQLCADHCLSQHFDIIQEEKEKRSGSLPIYLEKSGIPLKLQNLNWQLQNEFKKYIPPFDPKKVNDGKGLCLFGGSGVGKTVTVALIAREWIKGYIENYSIDGKMPWAFVSYPAFIMRLQSSFKKDNGDSAYDLMNELTKKPFIIIDDLGVEKPTEFVKQSTYYILNEREINCLPTFITTNFSLDKLNAQLDERISSRIAGMCDVKEIKGADRRIKK